MKKLMLALLTIVLLALAAFAAIPFVTKVIGPSLLNVDPPSGEVIGEVDYPKTETSHLSVKLVLPIAALESLANKHKPKEFGEAGKKNFHKRVRNGALQWKLIPGKISLENTGRNLGFSVPIQGAAAASGEIDAKLVQVPVQGTADLGGTINGTMKPEVSESWQISPNLNPALKLSRANISIGSIGSFSARSLIEEAANPIIKREAAKIGPQLRKELNLKQTVQKLWNQAHLVEQINAEPAAWIVIDPAKVSLTPIDYSVQDSLSVVMGMTANSYVTNVQSKRPVREKLPPLRVVRKPPQNDIRVPVIANIKELNETLASETLSVDTPIGAKVEVTAPEVQVGTGGFLNLSLNLNTTSGKWGRGVSGRIWVEAKPIVDYEKQTLGFAEVKLTVETREALSRAAAWLLEELIVKSIEKELRADLKDYLPELQEEIDKFLAADTMPEEVELSVEQPEVKLLDVYTVTRPSENAAPSPGIVVVLGAKGNISARLRP